MDGRLLSSLVGHKSQVRCCVFDNTGNFLATACSGDSSAKVTNTTIAMYIHVHVCHFLIQIWDILTQNCFQTLSHSCPVLSCDFSPDQERLVTGNTDGVILVSIVYVYICTCTCIYA